MPYMPTTPTVAINGQAGEATGVQTTTNATDVAKATDAVKTASTITDAVTRIDTGTTVTNTTTNDAGTNTTGVATKAADGTTKSRGQHVCNKCPIDGTFRNGNHDLLVTYYPARDLESRLIIHHEADAFDYLTWWMADNRVSRITRVVRIVLWAFIAFLIGNCVLIIYILIAMHQ